MGRLTSADGAECVILSLDQIFIDITSTEMPVSYSRSEKNRDGYFDAEDLLAQVDKAIDILEDRTNRFATGLWLFDNAPSHQK
jgi:hypothetical protein